jgi:putative sugar O-methyltransferase
MNSKNFTKSKLWELNLEKNFGDFDLNNFREIGGPNKKLGSWDPIDNSTRYFKALLYAFAEHLDTSIRYHPNLMSQKCSKDKGDGLAYYLGSMQNMNLGNPETINFYGLQLSIDYLLSVEEMFFLHDTISECSSVLEIGAGFGRLAHAVIENYTHIQEYTICDLPEMLQVSQKFLSNVLTADQFKKINFCPNDQFHSIQSSDLCINIDSFQEMPASVVLNYIEGISSFAKYLYSKNAICKYDPSIIGLEVNDRDEYGSALEQGLCTEVFNIYDSQELSKAREIYLHKYCPRNFQLIKDQQSFGQYLFYHSALFQFS